ncbi:MAG: DUF4105 domain-containing protein [Pseudomonadota bacterium]
MRWLSLFLTALACLAVALVAAWGSLALWFKLPGPEAVRYAIAGAFALLGARALVALCRPAPARWTLTFGAACAALLLWWATLEPPRDGDWAPEVARQVTGQIEGNTLTLSNLRAFEWRSEAEFTEAWVTRSYDLSRIESVDLFMSYWGGPAMAHLMISFGFGDGTYLAWSVEVKRAVGASFSPVADFFKANSLSVVASEERDVVGLRTNVQNADVILYRLRSDPARRRAFLEEYVQIANAVAERPQFFNSLLSNCSKTVINLARAVGAPLPADWRVLVNGYFPEYLYELGAMNADLSFSEIRQQGSITARAQSAGLDAGFSQSIRIGVPAP